MNLRKTIKNILKEEGEFDWTEENNVHVPLDEIHLWCENNKDQISEWITKINEFYETVPKMGWDGNDDFSDKNKMSALSVKGIGDELRNIFSSFKTISEEMRYLKNPDLYDED